MINKIGVAKIDRPGINRSGDYRTRMAERMGAGNQRTVADLFRQRYQNGAIVALSKPHPSELSFKETGIVRRIDDLGRVVIPKALRQEMEIEENDPLEYYTYGDSIILKNIPNDLFQR